MLEKGFHWERFHKDVCHLCIGRRVANLEELFCDKVANIVVIKFDVARVHANHCILNHEDRRLAVSEVGQGVNEDSRTPR